MWKVRELADKVTNVVMNYTEIEAKVREATNDDPWGTTGTLRHELAQATFSYDQFPEVMGMLWKRIAENKRSPRRIYKSLLLVHHLLLNGSDRVIRATTDRLYEIRQLQDYHVVYEPGFNLSSIIPVDEYKDGEMNVRVKAKEIVELVQDEERLREERKKSKKNRDKYVGIGSDRSATKWNDFDEDLQFPRQSSSKFDDFDGDDDNSSIGIGSKSKHSNNKDKESPKSINIKLRGNDDDDDFNPRATEEVSNSKSAATKAAVDKNTSGSGPAPTVSLSDGGDFADFQSAFGGSSSGNCTGANNSANQTSSHNIPNSSLANHSSHDFFTSDPTPNQSSSSNVNSSIDLLGLDMSPSILSSPAQTNVISSNSATLSSSFDVFQSFQAGPVQNLGQASVQGSSVFNIGGTSPGLTFQSAPSQIFQQPFQFGQQQHPQTQPPHTPLQDHNMLFDGLNDEGDNLGPGLLQPQQVKNFNNNHVVGSGVAGDKVARNNKALEGTTWSDLNFSIDDLSLSSKPKQTTQPTMNQLTRSKPF